MSDTSDTLMLPKTDFVLYYIFHKIYRLVWWSTPFLLFLLFIFLLWWWWWGLNVEIRLWLLFNCREEIPPGWYCYFQTSRSEVPCSCGRWMQLIALLCLNAEIRRMKSRRRTISSQACPQSVDGKDQDNRRQGVNNWTLNTVHRYKCSQKYTSTNML